MNLAKADKREKPTRKDKEGLKPPYCCWQSRNQEVIECNGETDIVQCRACGSKRKCHCNFDDDFA